MTTLSNPTATESHAARRGVGPVGSATILAAAAIVLCLPFAFGVAHSEWLVWIAIGAAAGFSLSGST